MLQNSNLKQKIGKKIRELHFQTDHTTSNALIITSFLKLVVREGKLFF